MILYSSNYFLLGGVFAAFISMSVFAEDKRCQFDDLNFKMEIVGCSYEGDVSVLKLSAYGKVSYETNLENIPTFVVSGSDLSKVLDVVGGGAGLRYNQLINLPYPEAILHYDDASAAAKNKLSKPGWSLLDMGVVVYEGQGGEEGAGVVCSTLERKIDSKYVVVSQCNGFYDGDVSDLKATLDLLVDHK